MIRNTIAMGIGTILMVNFWGLVVWVFFFSVTVRFLHSSKNEIQHKTACKTESKRSGHKPINNYSHWHNCMIILQMTKNNNTSLPVRLFMLSWNQMEVCCMLMKAFKGHSCTVRSTFIRGIGPKF